MTIELNRPKGPRGTDDDHRFNERHQCSQPLGVGFERGVRPCNRSEMMVTIDDGDDGVSGETLLGALDEARVFNVSKEETGRFRIEESCDNWFFAVLTREQLLALADELRALAGS